MMQTLEGRVVYCRHRTSVLNSRAMGVVRTGARFFHSLQFTKKIQPVIGWEVFVIPYGWVQNPPKLKLVNWIVQSWLTTPIYPRCISATLLILILSLISHYISVALTPYCTIIVDLGGSAKTKWWPFLSKIECDFPIMLSDGSGLSCPTLSLVFHFCGRFILLWEPDWLRSRLDTWFW